MYIQEFLFVIEILVEPYLLKFKVLMYTGCTCILYICMGLKVLISVLTM